MTPQELQEERQYRIQERLGILCDDNRATPEQVALAEREADAAVKQLKEHESRN